MAILKGDLEISNYLQIGIATLRRHSAAVPHRRIGNIKITTTETLDSWLASSVGSLAAVRESNDGVGITVGVREKSKKQTRKVGRPSTPAISAENSSGGNK